MLMLVEVSKKLGGSGSLFLCAGSWSQTQLRLGGRSLNPLSRLAGHILDFSEETFYLLLISTPFFCLSEMERDSQYLHLLDNTCYFLGGFVFRMAS